MIYSRGHCSLRAWDSDQSRLDGLDIEFQNGNGHHGSFSTDSDSDQSWL